jgi:hypothetical protein
MGCHATKSDPQSESVAIPKDFKISEEEKIFEIEASKMQLFSEFRCNMRSANWQWRFSANA